MVIDLTEDSESGEERRSKMPRLSSLSDDEEDQDIKKEDLLRAFLSPERNSPKRKSPDGDHEKKLQVVIPSPRPISVVDSSSVKQSSSVSTDSFHVHNGLSDFFTLNDDEERIKKSSYLKAKQITQKTHLALATPYHPPTVKTSSGLRRSTKSLLNALDVKKLEALKGPPVSLDIGFQKLSIDSNFQFLNEYKLQDGVIQEDPVYSPPCNCGEICDFEYCDCVADVDDSESDSQSNKRIVQYIKGPNGLRVLDPSFINRTAMIFECSFRCPCADTCFNRVVQHGRTVKLQIFETKGHARGFGLRSPEPIYAGQFIDCYLGEVITQKEADIREEADAAKGNHEASYLFSLDFFDIADDCMNVVDGRKFGGVTRFMNHSCRPNCKLFPATQNHGDRYIYDLAFFALRDIPPMTELTFDYNPKWNGSRGRVDPDAVKCLCGESNCRGQLWPNKRKTNR